MDERALFMWIGVPIILIGVVLLAWLLRIEFKQRGRRCPKCWYDMSGSASLQCPECGRDAKRERRLHRIQWKRKRLIAAVVLIGLGVGTMRWPAFRTYHWPGLVPTRVLIALWDKQEWDWDWPKLELSERFGVDIMNNRGWYSKWEGNISDADRAAFVERIKRIVRDPGALPGSRDHMLRWLDRSDEITADMADALPSMLTLTNGTLMQTAVTTMVDNENLSHALEDDEVINLLLIISKSRTQRRWAVRALAHSSHADAQQHMMNMLTSDDVDTRRMAVRYVSTDAPFLPLLMDLLHDPHTRHRVARQLGEAEVSPDEVLPVLAIYLDGEVRDAEFAMRALAAYGPHAQPYVDEIAAFLHAPEERLRQSAVGTLSSLAELDGSEAAIPFLISDLERSVTVPDRRAVIIRLARLSLEKRTPHRARIRRVTEPMIDNPFCWEAQQLDIMLEDGAAR